MDKPVLSYKSRSKKINWVDIKHPEQLIPVVEIDTELQLKEINDKFFRILKQFQPFGPENLSPVFISENVVDNGYGRTVGPNGEHLKLTLIQEENPFKVFPAIAFHQGQDFNKVNKEYSGFSPKLTRLRD